MAETPRPIEKKEAGRRDGATSTTRRSVVVEVRLPRGEPLYGVHATSYGPGEGDRGYAFEVLRDIGRQNRTRR